MKKAPDLSPPQETLLRAAGPTRRALTAALWPEAAVIADRLDARPSAIRTVPVGWVEHVLAIATAEGRRLAAATDPRVATSQALRQVERTLLEDSGEEPTEALYRLMLEDLDDPATLAALHDLLLPGGLGPQTPQGTNLARRLPDEVAGLVIASASVWGLGHLRWLHDLDPQVLAETLAARRPLAPEAAEAVAEWSTNPARVRSVQHLMIVLNFTESPDVALDFIKAAPVGVTHVVEVLRAAAGKLPHVTELSLRTLDAPLAEGVVRYSTIRHEEVLLLLGSVGANPARRAAVAHACTNFSLAYWAHTATKDELAIWAQSAARSQVDNLIASSSTPDVIIEALLGYRPGFLHHILTSAWRVDRRIASRIVALATGHVGEGPEAWSLLLSICDGLTLGEAASAVNSLRAAA